MKELVQKEIDKGVSRRRLALLVGVSLGTVQNVLLGDTEIKNSTLDKFYRYFNVQSGQFSPEPATDPEPSKQPDQVTLRDILKLQESITDLTKTMLRIEASLGAEIGWIKERMAEASQTGDVHRLGVAGGKGR